MSFKNMLTDIMRLHRRLNGGTAEYDLSFYEKFFTEIKKHITLFERKSDGQIKNLSRQLINKAANAGSLDDLLVEAYIIVRESIQRILKIRPYDVQVIGGIALHFGKIIEMQTGEGKTLTAVFPSYLNALTGKGVHVLTFNDYLARRDAVWTGPVYKFLGLSAGYIREGMNPENRRAAYNSDITYLTAKEAGFDYLRDGLCFDQRDVVRRPFNFGLVDEADSIMIDEARIPLVIAGSSIDAVENAGKMAALAKQLKENADFEFDKNARNIYLTGSGIRKSECLLNCGNLFAEDNVEILSRLNCALHAEYLLRRDVDYIIREGKIELGDEFTGRVADKRRWPDGLQAAIEAKENIAVQSRGNILNSLTLQNFLRLYPKICGMTATAKEAEREFKRFYNLDIVIIPPEKPCIRKDYPDLIFKSKADKYEAFTSEIINVHRTGRPILIGTVSVEESEALSCRLGKAGLQSKVLNAKNDEYEAEIIAEAGMPGAITISTNMAGRGTDIKLGGEEGREKDKVAALGGLYVIGTSRHESRRIDNQLRGRAGRQGDPGASRFFISLEDGLFIKYNLKKLLPSNFEFNEDPGKTHQPSLVREIARVQRIIEGQNLEIKKTLYEYSFLIEQQRRIIGETRESILRGNSFYEYYKSNFQEQYETTREKFLKFNLPGIYRKISLLQIDNAWSGYLADIADIKEGIHLLRLGGQNPIEKFREQSVELFDRMFDELEDKTICSINKLTVKNNKINFDDSGLNVPTATWTYLINDNPFEDQFGIGLIGNMNLQIGAGAYGFLLVFYALLKKFDRKNKNTE